MIANSVDPNQDALVMSSLIRVCTVCLGLSVVTPKHLSGYKYPIYFL